MEQDANYESDLRSQALALRVQKMQQDVADKQRTQVASMVSAYMQNPQAFSDDEVYQLKQAADSVGVPFNPRSSGSRMASNFIFNAMDTALLGFLPDSIGPRQITSGDSIAASLGNVAGFAVPGALGWMAGGKALKGVEAIAAGREVPIANSIGIGRMFGKQSGRVAELEIKAREALNKALVNDKLKSLAAKMASHPNYFKAAVGLPVASMANNFFEGSTEDEGY